MAAGHPHAANLDAGIDEALCPRDADLQPQIEIVKRPFRGDEGIVRNFLRQRAGGDEAALHSPQVVLVLEHLPSRKGFAVE